MDIDQEAARRFIHRRMRETGLNASALAKRAGLSSTTLTRVLNDPTATHTLTARTMRKVEEVEPRSVDTPAFAELREKLTKLDSTNLELVSQLISQLCERQQDAHVVGPQPGQGARLRALIAEGEIGGIAELAKAIDSSPNEVDGWIKEVAGIPLCAAVRLRALFSVSLDWLYLGDPSALPVQLSIRLALRLSEEGEVPSEAAPAQPLELPDVEPHR